MYHSYTYILHYMLYTVYNSILCYYIGIIDILQVYNLNKRSETVLKTIIGQNR